jgi:hypothetical protein
MAASAPALKSRRDGFFVILSLPGARIVLASPHGSQVGSHRFAAQ